MPGCRAGGTLHNHTTVAEVRWCWWRVYNPAPTPPVAASPPPQPAAPVAPVRPIRGKRNWRNDPVTDPQIEKIERLGGDTVYAHKLTKGEASDYIERLIKGEVNVEQPTPAPRTSRQEDPKLAMVKGMIDMVPDGNYATAPQGEDRHVDFVRITRPTSGKDKGKLVIQTRHSDVLKKQIIGNPNGYWEFLRTGSWRLVDMLMEIIQDYKTCALRYSVEAKACSHCATPLTDDRSRHYLVGPICEKVHGYVWPVIFAIDANDGLTYEELVDRDMPRNQHHQAFINRAS